MNTRLQSQSQSQSGHDVPDTDVRDSNPGGNSADGLAGDLGISSERTGPDAATGSAVDGIEGTGSHGSATHATDGVKDSTAPEEQEEIPREHTEEPAEGGDPDGAQPEQERTSTEEPAEGTDDPAHTSAVTRDTPPPSEWSTGDHVNGDNTSILSGVDRTVGEKSPDPVANPHEFDPSRNPRH